MRPMVDNHNPVNSHVTINSTNVTHHIIHPSRQIHYDPDMNRMTNVISSANVNTNMLNNNGSNQQNAPGHVRFTSNINSASSTTSSSSSNTTTHPKSILRRKNLNSSSNVVTLSHNNHNNDCMQGYKI